jgi:predicted  nucleic acid-binding Zn-ribbon protein
VDDTEISEYEKKRREARKAARAQRRGYASSILDDYANLRGKIENFEPMFAQVLAELEDIRRQIQRPRDAETRILARRLKLDDTFRTIATAKAHIASLSRVMQRSETSKEYILESFENDNSAFE